MAMKNWIVGYIFDAWTGARVALNEFYDSVDRAMDVWGDDDERGGTMSAAEWPRIGPVDAAVARPNLTDHERGHEGLSSNGGTLTELPDREDIAKALTSHHPTRGMSVSMGVTCECGYWTGSEPESGKRPLPWGRDSLDLHRADVVADLLEREAGK